MKKMKLVKFQNTKLVKIENGAGKAQKNPSDWTSDFFDYVSDRKPSTVTTYTKAIKRWAKYLAEQAIIYPTRDTVRNYKKYLQDEIAANRLSDNTARLYLTAVKIFFRWLASENHYPNVADGVGSIKVETNTHRRDALTVDEGRKLLSSMSEDSEKALRDKCIIALMMSCALRSVEVTRLNVGDIKKRRGKLFLTLWGKGRAGRSDKVMLPPQCYELIKRYLKLRGNVDKKSPLFVSTSKSCKGARLETQTISRLSKSAMVQAGYDSPHLTCHSLRHTAATLMLECGVAIENVQMILRHKSQNTTQIYRHDLDEYKNDGTLYTADTLFKDWHNR